MTEQPAPIEKTVSYKSLKGPRSALPFFVRRWRDPDFNNFHYLAENESLYGTICRLPIPLPDPVIQVSDPELIGCILMGTEKSNKKSIFFDRVQKVVGAGLIVSGGETWRIHRRLANPAFHPRMTEMFRQVIETATLSLAERWREKAARGETVDVSQEISGLMLQIIVRILFSSDAGGRSAVVHEAMRALQDYSDFIFYTPVQLPIWWPDRMHRRLRKAIKTFDAMTQEIINDHRAAPDQYNDLLSALLEAQEEGVQLSDTDLKDEMLSMILAGHETTAASLSMGIDAVSLEPEISAKMLAELQTLTGPGVGPEEIKGLDYTGLVQQEILRLYPAVWSVSRTLLEPLTFRNVVYPKGTVFLLVQQLTHRQPKLWIEPERFWPERFVPEQSQGRHPFAFFPFGGGARTCLGMGLARLEMKMVFAILWRQFKFERVPGVTHKLLPKLTTTAEPGIRLKITPRV